MGADFTRFYRYDDLTALLRRWEAAHPGLIRVVSAGRGYEGRDIWAAEVTDYSTGSAVEKPAAYVEGNIHAGEVTGSQVCLYLLDYLLGHFGQDPRVTELLRTHTYYVLPRVNPDGAERHLTTPGSLRSSVRPYPDDDAGEAQGAAEAKAAGGGPQDGLVPEDVDGDGRILQMRVEDPGGEWRVSRLDRRLMLRRRPSDRLERDGPFYRVLTEGIVGSGAASAAGSGTAAGATTGATTANADTGSAASPSQRRIDHTYLKFPPPRAGLDTNRNWPANWRPEHMQQGAGPFPLSEPETRAVAEYMMARRNIATVMTFHTSGGQVIRPMSGRKDEDLPKADVALFDAVGRRGAELTGYDYMGVMEFSGGNFLFGDYQDWAYEHLGMLAYCIELWNMGGRAGVARRGRDAAATVTEEERGLALLKWNDRELQGKGFTEWHPFDHLQLGHVEIGGWDRKYVLQNPPAQFLLGECHSNAMFMLDLAEATPLLRFRSVGARPVTGSPGLFVVTAEVENAGFLPTNVTEMALQTGVARTVTAILTPGPGVTLVHPGAKQDLGHLAGLGDRVNSVSFWMQTSPENRSVVKVEWLVDATMAPAGASADTSPTAESGAGADTGAGGNTGGGSGAPKVEIEAASPKGGRCRTTVVLGNEG